MDDRLMSAVRRTRARRTTTTSQEIVGGGVGIGEVSLYHQALAAPWTASAVGRKLRVFLLRVVCNSIRAKYRHKAERSRKKGSCSRDRD